MTLETMQPTDEASVDDDVLDALGAADNEFLIFGGDWCGDCQRQLPDFAAALAAAGVGGDRIHHYPVEKETDGSKTGPGVDEYGIEYIPTVVVERGGREVARFVESADRPIAEYLARELRALDAE